ncbi:MAG: GntR family transcriptional regulator [Planctomycetes bacterium]|nr:GntR family transcriptional regulator [Planctomycetota bacterium]
MLFTVDPSRSEAVYAQVMHEIRQRIARGLLNAGDRLPTVRDLAQTLVVNPNTVGKAYQLLESEGVISTRRGVGTFVADVSPKLSLSARRERVNELLDRLLTEAYHMGFNQDSLMDTIEKRMKSFQTSGSRRRGQ